MQERSNLFSSQLEYIRYIMRETLTETVVMSFNLEGLIADPSPAETTRMGDKFVCELKITRIEGE